MSSADSSCVGRTSLWMYYVAVAAIILGVILAILFIFCCTNLRLKTWAELSFLFAIALGVAALFQGGLDMVAAKEAGLLSRMGGADAAALPAASASAAPTASR